MLLVLIFDVNAKFALLIFSFIVLDVCMTEAVVANEDT